jgi:hypothetical protein
MKGMLFAEFLLLRSRRSLSPLLCGGIVHATACNSSFFVIEFLSSSCGDSVVWTAAGIRALAACWWPIRFEALIDCCFSLLVAPFSYDPNFDGGVRTIARDSDGMVV